MSTFFPRVGLRVWKSVAAVLLCLLLAMAVQREDMRIYASIAALQCIQPYVDDMRRMVRQRVTGTVIGAAYGAALIFLELSLLRIHGSAGGYLLIAAFIAPVLVTATRFHAEDAAYFSCVVFLSITVTHVTDADPWLFVWHRVAETFLGIAVGMGVNSLRLPRRPRRDTLFVPALEDGLLGADGRLTPYSRVLLNRMADGGALLSLSTARTPAAVRESMEGVRLRLPVIVMDGAAVYDLNRRAFLHARTLDPALAEAAGAVFDRCGVHYFLSGLLNDILLVSYGDFHNDAERDLYARMRVSPYRNYVERRLYRQGAALYLLALERTEVLEPAAEQLRAELGERVKLELRPAAEYPGYSYLKLCDASASRQAMLELLRADLGAERTVTLGPAGAGYDVAVPKGGGSRAVHLLERRYAPYLWERRGGKP